jgi:RHS repeat-associated protein
MLMPGRKYPAAGGLYRYGFNGKENDNEVKGEGNQQDYGMRIYDPRLMRFLSVDPLTKDYPSWSTYPFCMNRPIDGIDLDGLEWAPSTACDFDFMSAKMRLITTNYIKLRVIKESTQISAQEVKQKANIYKEAVEGSLTNVRPPLLLPSHIIQTEVILDFTPLLDKSDPNYEPAFGKLVFKDSKTSTMPMKMPDGTLQVVPVRIDGETKGEINAFTITMAVTMDDKPVNIDNFKKAAIHETAHSGGLNHPWEFSPEEAQGIPELNQNDPVFGKKKHQVQNYFMNSGDNPEFELKNQGNNVPNRSVEVMSEKIKNNSTRTVKEIKSP